MQADILVQSKLILWSGARHSGKTTAAGKLAEVARKAGFNIAGLLAPSIYVDGNLRGFEAVDLRNNARAPLAGWKANKGADGPFVFAGPGLKLGREALSPAAVKSAELVIVDEFGPLELNGGGWRKSVDSLPASTDALVVLVVRDEIVERVEKLYADIVAERVAAAGPQSIPKVITILRGLHRGKNE